MSVSKWAYEPDKCDGEPCVGDCDLCNKAKDDELWKPVKGYEGLYEVSNYGNVKSIRKNAVLSQIVNKNNGYCYVGMYKDGKNKKLLVHRLVAETFINNADNKKTVNHLDGNKQNNAVSNLEWATYSENHKHAFKNGLKTVTDNQRKAASKTGKKTCDQNRPKKAVVMIKGNTIINHFISAHEAARFVKGSPSAIVACCKGKANTCKGYRWEYAD